MIVKVALEVVLQLSSKACSVFLDQLPGDEGEIVILVLLLLALVIVLLLGILSLNSPVVVDEILVDCLLAVDMSLSLEILQLFNVL